MNNDTFATKGNLIKAKKTLALCTMGFDLLDRKRNVLIREILLLIDNAKALNGVVEETFLSAHEALENANITLGVIGSLAESVDIDDGLNVTYRNVMGVEIPQLELAQKPLEVNYGMYNTNSQLDIAYIKFAQAKRLCALLAETETAVFRLSNAIKRVQRTANSLKNVMIPKYRELVVQITDTLEEREREEFSQLKVIKSKKSG
ncbi:MAG: V-type ATP synthase subunit D [Oscillospiraceae bacterium]|nr:V-type ATP synthase subunit D [Oscillospiraceae bacterium]